MQRYTISIDDDLADLFDALLTEGGYGNRSEAVRDLLRERIERRRLEQFAASHCVATVSYVYDHREKALATRVADIQHDEHDLIVATMVVHLDHDNCLETVTLRGRTGRVRACAERLIAERGVRHGSINYIPVVVAAPHRHSHGPSGERHSHTVPIT